MLPRLSMTLAQVKAGKTAENILTETQQIVYFWYRTKKITKNIYNDIINSIQTSPYNTKWILNLWIQKVVTPFIRIG